MTENVWFGEIRSGWRAMRLKAAVRLIDRKISGPETTNAYIGLENVESWTGRLIATTEPTEPESTVNEFTSGDVLFGKLRPYLAKVVEVEARGICSTEFFVLRGRQIPGKYLRYILLSPKFIDAVNAWTYGVKMPRANWERVGTLPLPIPPPHVQQDVIDFLDRETAEADDLIANYERLLDLLEEKRVALITQAVTKGLDPNVRMKDSGVEWIGEIPAHWTITPFRYCGRIVEGQIDPKEKRFTDSILIAPNHVESNTGRLLSQETASEQGAISGKYRVRRGDVVYSKIRPALNKAVIATDDCLCSADMYPIQPTSRIIAEFLLYSILSKPFVSLATEVSMRVAMPKVNRETLSAIMISVPPLDEQREIVEHIKDSVSKVALLKDSTLGAIALMKERRSALITAAVTGQIDVTTYKSNIAAEVA